MTEPPHDLTDLLARLDRQAAAIRDLRARVTALENHAPETAPISEPSDTAAPVGVFTPRRQCMACGKTKEHGRNELTCVSCGRARNEAIKGGGVRPSYTSCGNCGSVKAPSMTLLCPPCSRSYSRWKTGQ